VKEHERKEGEDLFGKGEVNGDFRDGVPGGDEAVKKDKLVQVRPLGQLNEIDENVEGDKAEVHERDGTGSDGVSKRDHGASWMSLRVFSPAWPGWPHLYPPPGENAMNGTFQQHPDYKKRAMRGGSGSVGRKKGREIPPFSAAMGTITL